MKTSTNLANAAFDIFLEIEKITENQSKYSLYKWSEMNSVLLSLYRLFDDVDTRVYGAYLAKHLLNKKELSQDEFEVVMIYSPERKKDFKFSHFQQSYFNLTVN
jgi:hypothetical protein